MDKSWPKIGIIISAIVAIAAGVAAHFNGVSSAKIYTDQKVDKLETKMDKTFEKISLIQSDISAIKVKIQ